MGEVIPISAVVLHAGLPGRGFGGALSRVTGPALRGEGHNTEATPRVTALFSRLSVTRAKEEMFQEPADSVDVISPYPYPSERGALDQRSGRPTRVVLRRDAAKQAVDLRRVVTQYTTHEPRGPDLVAVHGRSITAGPNHRPQALSVTRRNATSAGCLAPPLPSG